MRSLLLLAVLAPSSGFAYDSIEQPLHFTDSYDVFHAAEVDTGYLPSGSPVAVRFYVSSEGGAYTDMDAKSQLSWPDALTQHLDGVPGTGLFELDTDIVAAADVQFDIWGYTSTLNVWSDELQMDATKAFDPLLLPGAATTQIAVDSSGTSFSPYTFTYQVFTGVSLQFTLNMFPSASADLSGERIETNDQVQTEEGQAVHFDVPEDDPSHLDLTSTYYAWLNAELDLVLEPSVSICVDFIGCYDLATFDIPIPLVTDGEERAFVPVDYTHPLPSMLPPISSYDFGDVASGNLANLEVPLQDVGWMDLEGNAYIEGDAAFSVYPGYYYATPGSTDGIVVTFAPSDRSEHSATLVLASNDPLRPEIRIPLHGNGYDEDTVPDLGGDGASAEIKTCGCDASSSQGAGSMIAILAGLMLVRRRK